MVVALEHIAAVIVACTAAGTVPRTEAATGPYTAGAFTGAESSTEAERYTAEDMADTATPITSTAAVGTTAAATIAEVSFIAVAPFIEAGPFTVAAIAVHTSLTTGSAIAVRASLITESRCVGASG